MVPKTICIVLFTVSAALSLSGQEAGTAHPSKAGVHDPAGAVVVQAASVPRNAVMMVPVMRLASMALPAPLLALTTQLSSLAMYAGSSQSLATDDRPNQQLLSIKGTSTQQWTPAEFAKLPHQSLAVQNGHSHQSETYAGVPLIDLLQKVGAPVGADVKGKTLAEYVVATGSDGYKAVLSLGEVEPGFHPGTILVADQMGSKPLDAGQGPFKLVVSEDTRPARSVHNLVSLELRQAE